MLSIKLSELVAWCDGSVSQFTNLDLLINNVVIDSRHVTENCLFVAIKGANQDGHIYVRQTINDKRFNNTVVALVKNDNAYDFSDVINLIYVDDPILALGKIAYEYRKLFPKLKLIAVTGSHGKTSTKNMMQNICNFNFGSDAVLATSGNLNNHLGVPLMLLKIMPQHLIAIIEMGMNHAGEIAYLTKMAQPDIAIITNIHMVHIEAFDNIDGIAMAKGEIYTGIVNKGTACVDIGSQFANLWLSGIRNDINVLKYGTLETNYYIKQTENVDKNQHTTLCINGRDINFSLKMLGAHNNQNALVAAVATYQIGCSFKNIVDGLENYTGYDSRLEQKKAFNGATIIDDSYNAGPASVEASIDVLIKFDQPRWYIFADMKELGIFMQEEHTKVANLLEHANLDLLITIGECAKITHNAYSGKKLHFVNNQDIIDYCKLNLSENSVVLIKGSRSMNLNQVVNGLIG